MIIEGIPFCSVDWNTITPEKHAGVTGEALWKTFQAGDVRVRMVEYTPGYVADHWCSKGHVILILEGELVTELSDGRKFVSAPGMCYLVADDVNPHRSYTETGVKMFIVD